MAVQAHVGTISETLYLRLVFFRVYPRTEASGEARESLHRIAGAAYADGWSIDALQGLLSQVEKLIRYAHLLSAESETGEGQLAFERAVRSGSPPDLMTALEAALVAYRGEQVAEPVTWGPLLRPRVVALRMESPLTMLLAAPFAGAAKFLEALLDLAVATWNVKYRIAADRAEQVARMRAAEREDTGHRLAMAQMAGEILKLENSAPVDEIDVWVSRADQPPPALDQTAG